MKVKINGKPANGAYVFGERSCPSCSEELRRLGVGSVSAFYRDVVGAGGGVGKIETDGRRVHYVDCSDSRNASVCASVPVFPLTFHCEDGVCAHVSNPRSYIRDAPPQTTDFVL